MRQEVKRAFVWIGIASLVALTVLLAQPLLVIFGGMVFATLIDGGSRLLHRVLPIGRGWRVAIVLLATVAFIVWTLQFAGSQIASQAAALPAILESQWMVALKWLESQGFAIEAKDLQGLVQQALGGIGQLTRAVGGIIGASKETIVEEMPQAYKDVADVVDVVARGGIASKVVRIRPIGCVKG